MGFTALPREKWNERQKMKKGEGEGKGKEGNYLSFPSPPRSFACAILTLLPPFFAPKRTETLAIQASLGLEVISLTPMIATSSQFHALEK